jgi:CP family cyanate transporter-like MFS transporter
MALAVWSLPVALTALAILLATPAVAGGRAAGVPTRWWPDWRSGRTWRLGLILGAAGIAYFGGNTFIPEYLKAKGHSDLIAPSLTCLNLSQLPASLLIAARPHRFIGRRAPLVVCGALILLAILAFLGSTGVWSVVWAGLLGMAAGAVFILSLALPPLLSEAHDVHRLSAAMFTISYSYSFTGPPIGGAIWDLTGKPALAFLPVIAASLLMMVLALGITTAPPARHGLEPVAQSPVVA